jgi:hypothetical protein
MAWKIDSFSPYLLTLKEIDVLASRAIHALESSLAGDGYIQHQIAGLQKTLKVIEATFARNRRSGFTTAIREKNRCRRKAYRGVLGYLDAMADVYGVWPEKRSAALQVLEVIGKSCRGLDRLSYVEQSAAMMALLSKLKAEKLQKPIAILGVTECVEQLDAAQNEFEATYLQKVESEKRHASALTAQAREESILRLGWCLQYVESLAFDQTEKYARLVDDLNTIIGDVTMVARIRQTRKTHEGKKRQAAVVISMPASQFVA